MLKFYLQVNKLNGNIKKLLFIEREKCSIGRTCLSTCYSYFCTKKISWALQLGGKDEHSKYIFYTKKCNREKKQKQKRKCCQILLSWNYTKRGLIYWAHVPNDLDCNYLPLPGCTSDVTQWELFLSRHAQDFTRPIMLSKIYSLVSIQYNNDMRCQTSGWINNNTNLCICPRQRIYFRPSQLCQILHVQILLTWC